MWRLLLKGFACCLRYGCENAAHSLFLLEQIKDTFHPSGDEIKYERGASVPGELPLRVLSHALRLLPPAHGGALSGQVLPGSCPPVRGQHPVPACHRKGPHDLHGLPGLLLHRGCANRPRAGRGTRGRFGAPVGLSWVETSTAGVASGA